MQKCYFDLQVYPLHLLDITILIIHLYNFLCVFLGITTNHFSSDWPTNKPALSKIAARHYRSGAGQGAERIGW